MRRRRWRWGWLVVVAWAAGGTPAGAGEIGQALAERLRSTTTHERVAVVVQLRGGATPPAPDGSRPRAAQRAQALATLQARHAALRAGTAAMVDAAARSGRGRMLRDLWVAAALEVEVEPALVPEIAALPEVEVVDVAGVAAVVVPVEDGAELDDTPPAVYGVRRIRAPQVWALGTRGRGALIAVIDTGFKRGHDDIRTRWRSTNGWHDALGRYPLPDDDNGHGTHVTGTLVGRAGVGANIVGVAPDAQVIACRAFNGDGFATLPDLLECMQWVADPDGNPWTDDAPDVVNASWGFEGETCGTPLDAALATWAALDIVAVFAAGNNGVPNDPASNPAVLAVGAVDRADAVPWWSGHGVSRCNGEVYPDLVAPGVRVRSSWPGQTRKNLKGTSMAAPHVSGTVALLRSRRPTLTAAEIGQILRASALDLWPPGPDTISGYGLVDAYRAVLCVDRGSFSGCAAQCP